MEYSIEGRAVVTLRHNEGDATSKLVSVDFNLDASKNIDKRNFFTEQELPNQAGTKALTQCFIQGLAGNIHQGHENGYWDSAEHLRYVISELERAFVAVPNIQNSHFKD